MIEPETFWHYLRDLHDHVTTTGHTLFIHDAVRQLGYQCDQCPWAITMSYKKFCYQHKSTPFLPFLRGKFERASLPAAIAELSALLSPHLKAPFSEHFTWPDEVNKALETYLSRLRLLAFAKEADSALATFFSALRADGALAPKINNPGLQGLSCEKLLKDLEHDTEGPTRYERDPFGT